MSHWGFLIFHPILSLLLECSTRYVQDCPGSTDHGLYIYMVYQHYRYRPVISSSPRKFPGCIADSARGFPSIILLWFSKSTNLTILGVSIRNSRHPLAALVSKTSRWPGGFGGSAQALQFLDQALQLGLPAVFTSKQRHVMILFV